MIDAQTSVKDKEQTHITIGLACVLSTQGRKECFCEGRIKACAGSGAVSKMRAPDKLLMLSVWLIFKEE